MKKKYPLLTEPSTVAIVFYRDVFAVVPKSNNDQALLLNRQGPKKQTCSLGAIFALYPKNPWTLQWKGFEPV